LKNCLQGHLNSRASSGSAEASMVTAS
jgi:hypothetical protein